MSVQRIQAAQAMAQLERYDTVIDARSPAEFAADRLPGAVNWPALDDEQRRIVGTLYTQVSAFEARKLGAVLVARNIAAHVERETRTLPASWRPLVYCWRGGQRSGALALVLGQIGFRVSVLEGGYKAFRTCVRSELEQLPARLSWRVLCGRTGTGKTRLLQALADVGAQVLDLEALAKHRGSVLGARPGHPQPTQKAFETLIWQALRRFDPTHPVHVESESAKVGQLRVPDALLQHMRQGPCIQMRMPLPARVELLLADYPEFVQDAAALCARLAQLTPLRGKEQVAHWQDLANRGRFAELVEELLILHYDPVYDRSTRLHYGALAQSPAVDLPDGSPATLAAAARRLAQADSPVPPAAGPGA